MPSPSETRAIRLIETTAAAAAITFAHRLGERAAGPLFDRILRELARLHPRAFATIGELPEATVLIDPQDQSAVIALTVGPSPRVRIVERGSMAAAAGIRGPLESLMDLLEGRIDGDALFFRRELKIEGDTELVVAVRNAFDGEDMDLAADIAAAFGPLRYAVTPLRRGASRAAAVLADVRSYLLRPVNSRIDGLERRLARLDRGDA